MIVVLLGYIAIIVATAAYPLPLYMEAPLVFVGWLFLPGLYVWSKILRIDTRASPHRPTRDWLRPWALTVAFGAIAIVAVYLAAAWDVPSRCPVSLDCVKGYEWRTENGKYYHVIEGVTTEISQKDYAQEIGIDLRSAAAFGVYALCLAFVATAVLMPPSAGPKLPSQ